MKFIRVEVARKGLIRDDSFQGCGKGQETRFKEELANKYAVSISTVEKSIVN